jgi:hypothetical protein
MIYEWFGFSLKIKYGLVAVGAPQSRICFLYSFFKETRDIYYWFPILLMWPRYQHLFNDVIIEGKRLIKTGYK